ncbi:hypothetical protein C1Y63_05645 [Corynebacterium sp. 13CS0277]|uniref:hypothetical protein n=1 Tax=Corynebacterium sp. 13CS0277 TaxID=2071994 RepID=UPI000D03080A|nr:hypothetical protein [Corynebacterium sp. 13CS0277]PRQ11487.1 hypothetical protein C1Y63_05645 [Corynebacterium sp. 13CS0277]
MVASPHSLEAGDPQQPPPMTCDSAVPAPGPAPKSWAAIVAAILTGACCLAWLLFGTPYRWAGPLWQDPPMVPLSSFAAIRLLPLDVAGTVCGVVAGVLGLRARGAVPRVWRWSVLGALIVGIATVAAACGAGDQVTPLAAVGVVVCCWPLGVCAARAAGWLGAPRTVPLMQWLDSVALPLALLPIAQSLRLSGRVATGLWLTPPLGWALMVAVVVLLVRGVRRHLASRGTLGAPGAWVAAALTILGLGAGVVGFVTTVAAASAMAFADAQGEVTSPVAVDVIAVGVQGMIVVATACGLVGLVGLIAGCAGWVAAPLVQHRIAHGMTVRQQHVTFRLTAIVLGGLFLLGFVFAGGGVVPSFSLHTGHALVPIVALPHPPLRVLYEIMAQQQGLQPYPQDADIPLAVAAAPFPPGGGVVLALSPATLGATVAACLGVWLLLWGLWPTVSARSGRRLRAGVRALPGVLWAVGAAATVWMLTHLADASAVLWSPHTLTERATIGGSFLLSHDYTPLVEATNSFQDAHALAICCFSFLLVHTLAATAVRRVTGTPGGPRWVWAGLAAAWWPLATGLVQTLPQPHGWAVSVSTAGPAALVCVTAVGTVVCVLCAARAAARAEQ